LMDAMRNKRSKKFFTPEVYTSNGTSYQRYYYL